MEEKLIKLLRCPVTRTSLQLQLIRSGTKKLQGKNVDVVWEGILFNESREWFYPVIDGVPRLLVEAFLDNAIFLRQHLHDYDQRRDNLLKNYRGLILYAFKKNKRTKKSFTQEWSIFNYEEDKTWDANCQQMIDRFLRETDETLESVNGKLVFDAGCGNGLLNQLMAQVGINVVAMDLSQSVVRAFANNQEQNVFFVQGDLQFPPVSFEEFDIVHASGVLICTNNTELSFSCIEPCVKPGGKLSVWLYHPRKNASHQLFNFARRFTSKLPLRIQYYLYLVTLFPVSYVVKKLKGNKQNPREMMIDILDWFTPQYRWEHTTDEASSWFLKRDYIGTKVTTADTFGFNITGIKNAHTK
jgi:SAM-dependent methyltransferase